MAALSLVIPAGYGLVLLEALAIGAHCVTEGFAAYAIRKRVFSKQFFNTNFPEVKPTPEDGYPGTAPPQSAAALPQPPQSYAASCLIRPLCACVCVCVSDIGHGRYSDKLPQRDWEDLGNAQRAHYNYVEQLPTVLTSLVRPQTATANPSINNTHHSNRT